MPEMLGFVHVDSIKVAQDRQRQEFGAEALTELMQSLRTVGMLHPVVVDDDMNLVAGERRLKAVRMLAFHKEGICHNGQQLEPGWLPYTRLSDQTPEGKYVAELHENTARENLTWQEKAAALAHLAAIRPKVEGESHAEATAALAHDVFPDRVANVTHAAELLVAAQHLDNPAVAKAGSLRDAVKIIRRSEARKRDEALGLAQGVIAASERHTLLHGDCIRILKELQRPAGGFTVLLTDPPYGMDADAFGDAAGKLTGITHEYKDTVDHALQLTEAMLEAAMPLMAEQAHLYLYCDIDQYHALKALVMRAGWKPHRTPLVHLKREGGRVPWPEHGPRRAYELVLYAVRGGKPVKAIKPDVFDTSLSEGNLGHGAQKPVEGFVELLSRSVSPGDFILDPFGGTGTTLVAAEKVQCHSTVIELDAAAYGIALQRLQSLS